MARTRRATALATALLALGALGCTSPSEPAPSPSTVAASPSPTGYGTRYELPAGLCEVADFTALLEVYPNEDTDSVLRTSTPNRCDTGFFDDERNRGLGVTLFAVLTDEALLAGNPDLTRLSFEAHRRVTVYEPIDITGVGSGAYWYADDDEMWFEAYDGNLRLSLFVFPAFSETLPPGMVDRLTAVVTGTFAALAP